MDKIHQYIPARYVESLCANGLHFSPCSTFVDKSEFRYGYCHDRTAVAMTGKFDECLAATFQKPEINNLIQQSHISCWTKKDNERFAMWEIYGRGAAAIRITVDRVKLSTALRTIPQRKASDGPVIYGSMKRYSFNRPEAITYISGVPTEQEDDQFVLFFRKHDFYRWEQEYRFVLLAMEAGFRLDARDFVTNVVVSPLEEMPAKDRKLLAETFGRDKVHSSALRNPYA